ncbi:MAG: hypothetical protein ACRYFK_01430 [Janthinobacterium lividum]
MLLQLNIIGWLLVGLALVHAGFPRYFNWRREFAVVSLLSQQVMYVHTFFVALTVGLLGLLCLTSAPELAGTSLGRRVALGCAVFWSARLLIQFVGYSPTLWRGKRFETTVHVVFAVLWTYVSAVFWWVALG